MENWIREELWDIDLGDERLNNRSKTMLERMAGEACHILNASFKGLAETKAAYRFLSNEKVTSEKILSPHYHQMEKRAEIFDVILHVQDTTQFNYSNKKQKIECMGKLRKEHEQGFFMHPTLTITGEGLCLGVAKTKIFTREKIMGKEGRAKTKREDIQDKESVRLLESYQYTQEEAVKNPHKTYINITDREGDFYELVEKYDENNPNAHLLIRGKKVDRIIKDEGDEINRLFLQLEKQPVACVHAFRLCAAIKKNAETRKKRLVR